MQWRRIVLPLVLLLALTGCRAGDNLTTATATVTATAAPSASSSAASSSPSMTPASTPTSAASPTVPSATPSLASPTRAASPATPTSSPTRLPATPATPSTAASGPPVYPTQPRNLGQPAAQTAHFRFYDPEGAHAATIAALAAEAEEIYAYLTARTGLQLDAPLPVVVQTQATSDCAARGVAYRDGPRIGLFATATTPLPQLRMFLAHETAHALHAPHYGRDLDLNLIEGFANWASLRYWSAWQGMASFDDAVRGYLAEGRFLPLDNPPRDCTIATRDVLYNERASFVGYLIDTYGLERCLAATDTAVPFQGGALDQIADYEGVYGQSFSSLLADWTRAVGGP